MAPATPSKPGSAASAGEADELTDVSSPAAPWDSVADAELADERERVTAQTAAISTAAYELAPGTALGEYRVERKIGQGGMGVVFSAVHPLIGKRAAIKILKQELCADPHTLERFIDEARVVNQIGHPNIVDVFAFGEMPDGRSYFVMEWLKGETLRERIARGRLTLAEVTHIVRSLARALEAAHDKGVIHRDLKPDNVFLVEVRDEPPMVKLLDFGIAKLSKADHRVEKTATGAIVGTPQYIAPEQAKGYAIDHRVDIYALGGIIFELLAGRPPFEADNAMEMVAKHLMETPAPPSSLAPEVPPELDDLVLRMLAKSPDARPTLAEVTAVLERSRLRASAPSAIEPSPGPTQDVVAVAPISQPAFTAPPPPASSRRLAVWAGLAGLVVAGVAAFAIVRALGDDGQPTPGADTPVAEGPTEPAPAPRPEPPPAPPPTTPKAPVAANPAPANGRLRLVVNARDAEVTIDGAAASLDEELAPGRHTVELHAPGMRPEKLDVTIDAGQRLSRRVVLVRAVAAPKPRANPPARPRPAPRPKVDPKPPPRPPVIDDDGLMTPGTLRRKP